MSVRSLLLVVLLAAVILGWVRHQMNRARDEHRAVEQLAQLGAHVQFYNEPSPRVHPFFADRATVIYDGNSPREVVVRLHCVRKLWRLYLDGSTVTDEDLEEIASLRGLERLSLRATAISDAGIEHLVRLRSLDHLDLGHTRVTNGALDSLRRLRLHSLDVTGTYVTEEENAEKLVDGFGVVSAGGAQNESERRAAAGLERLGARVSVYRGEDQKGLKYHVSIDARVTPRRWKGSTSDLASLAELPQVDLLFLGGIAVDDAAAKNIRSILGELRALRVFDASIVDAQLAEMLGGSSTDRATAGGTMDGLEDLVLSDVPITDKGLQSLERLVNLKRLSLERTRITDAGLVHLARLTHLESLDLSGTQIRGDGLRYIQGLRDLKTLELDRTQVCDRGLAHLPRLASLKRLSLWKTTITDRGLVHLKKMAQLQVLVIQRTAVTAAAADQLELALPKAEIAFP